jgi:hypothetical protein
MTTPNEMTEVSKMSPNHDTFSVDPLFWVVFSRNVTKLTHILTHHGPPISWIRYPPWKVTQFGGDFDTWFLMSRLGVILTCEIDQHLSDSWHDLDTNVGDHRTTSCLSTWGFTKWRYMMSVIWFMLMIFVTHHMIGTWCFISVVSAATRLKDVDRSLWWMECG